MSIMVVPAGIFYVGVTNPSKMDPCPVMTCLLPVFSCTAHVQRPPPLKRKHDLACDIWPTGLSRERGVLALRLLQALMVRDSEKSGSMTLR